MPALNQEETIMSSNDGSITLTTHRILQRSPKINKEIMLTDFISYEQINGKSNYYRSLMILFLAVSIIFGLVYYNKYQEAQTLIGRFNMGFRNSLSEHMSVDEQVQLYQGLFAFSSVLFGISLLLFLISSKRSLRITGKFSTIEFSTKWLRDDSYSKFLNGLITESDKRKRES